MSHPLLVILHYAHRLIQYRLLYGARCISYDLIPLYLFLESITVRLGYVTPCNTSENIHDFAV